ncbi:hypothetical protein HHI36_010052, partial [Cryptolaemus montrouzieri]
NRSRLVPDEESEDEDNHQLISPQLGRIRPFARSFVHAFHSHRSTPARLRFRRNDVQTGALFASPPKSAKGLYGFQQ